MEVAFPINLKLLIIISLLIACPRSILCFQTKGYIFDLSHVVRLPTKNKPIHRINRLTRNGSSNNSEEKSGGNVNGNNLENNIDSNLIRPPINIRKESILFSDNPTTAANNNIARTWKSMRMNLPYVITGATKDEFSPVDKNPIGAIYNVLFVRLPTVLAGLLYSKNLIQGHPLFCDVGAGPFEIPPLIVYGVLLVILR